MIRLLYVQRENMEARKILDPLLFFNKCSLSISHLLCITLRKIVRNSLLTVIFRIGHGLASKVVELRAWCTEW